jgi:predicted O-linked N-acetylglucosamine transferase (SPINDLY family)
MAVPKLDFETLVLKAWNGQFDLPTLFAHTNRLEAEGRFALAAVVYQTWLNRNQTSLNHLAFFNLGAALSGANDWAGAQAAYTRAIELSAGFVQPHFNLGMVHERLERPDAAIAEWLWVVQNSDAAQADQRDIRRQALNNLGRIYEIVRSYGDALTALSMSLEMDPAQPDVLHHWVFLRAKQCAWPVYAPVAGVDLDLMRRSTSAVAMIALSDDPQAQLEAARHYVKTKVKTNVQRLSRSKPYGHERLRIGYLSSDLCLHPVAILTAELFELHDRSRFEVYAYDWTKEDNSDLRKRIIHAMDRFVRIDGLSDEAAAKQIRGDEIDILVDLHGQTLGARADILAYRPAPIQITYLGLPATTGFPFIDYVIADRYLIPEDSARFYTEKPLYMPDVYQISDRKRPVATVPTREECGLPSEGFVFCSFNNNYKFTPEIFGAWMNILRRVPGSVLWLLADNAWSQANLQREAAQRGIDTARIVFASRVAPENYLARFGAADLFLDTFPFNAGTTANDALWMNLPVLTLSGRTFASRMAGALLTAAGLPELITADLNDYEQRAVEIGSSPELIQRARDVLKLARAQGVLFDTPRFVKHLEAHFSRLVAGLNPR